MIIGVATSWDIRMIRGYRCGRTLTWWCGSSRFKWGNSKEATPKTVGVLFWVATWNGDMALALSHGLLHPTVCFASMPLAGLSIFSIENRRWNLLSTLKRDSTAFPLGSLALAEWWLLWLSREETGLSLLCDDSAVLFVRFTFSLFTEGLRLRVAILHRLPVLSIHTFPVRAEFQLLVGWIFSNIGQRHFIIRVLLVPYLRDT